MSRFEIWQIGIGIANVVILGVFSYLIWKANKLSAKASNEMAILSFNISEEKKRLEMRNIMANLLVSYEIFVKCKEWLITLIENPSQLGKAPSAPFMLNLPSGITHEESAYLEKVIYRYNSFMKYTKYGFEEEANEVLNEIEECIKIVQKAIQIIKEQKN